MLAGIPEFREVDFSHLRLALTDSEAVEPARNPHAALWWWALLLSLLLHLSLLLVEFDPPQLYPPQLPTQTLHVDLLQAPVKKRDAGPGLMAQEIIAAQPDTKVMADVVISAVAKPVSASTEKSRAPPQSTRWVIEPLSAQELAAIVDNHQAEPGYQHPSAIAKNVFHSGLRAALNAEASKPVLARVEDTGLATHIDPSGATIVLLDNDGCLRSPPSGIGAARNWYVSVTPCPGKNASEKIMDRVEQSINGKLQFDKNSM